MKEFFKSKVKDIAMALALVMSALYVTAPVYAGTCASGISDTECNKICSNTSDFDEQQREAAGCTKATTDQLPKRVDNIVRAVISIVGILAVLVIAMAGQRYLTAGGDPGKIKMAKDMVLYAVIALIIAGLAYAVVTFVSSNINSNANMSA